MEAASKVKWRETSVDVTRDMFLKDWRLNLRLTMLKFKLAPVKRMKIMTD